MIQSHENTMKLDTDGKTIHSSIASMKIYHQLPQNSSIVLWTPEISLNSSG